MSPKSLISYKLSRGRKILLVLILSAFSLLFIFDSYLSSVLISRQGPGKVLADLGYILGHGNVMIPWLLAVSFLGLILKRDLIKRAFFRAFLAFACAGIIAQVIKHLVGRPRPRLEGIHHFGPSLASGFDSFPSGHTSSAFAVAIVLSYYFPRATSLFMFYAVLVSVGRLFGGSHFPSDVLGGAIVGLLTGFFLIHYFQEGLSFSFKTNKSLPEEVS